MWLLRRAREQLLDGAQGRELIVGVDDAASWTICRQRSHQLVLRGEAKMVLTIRSGNPRRTR